MSIPEHDQLVHALPYARRYARALSGSQSRGDALVADSLKQLLAKGTIEGDARMCLYRCVTHRFDQSGGRSGSAETGLSRTQRRLLLLTSLEGTSVEQAASIVGLSVEAAQRDLTEAREQLRASAAADVLIIEDEPIIAMDIEELVQNCGHRVVGVAANERDAVEIARRTRPGLILADINLGAGGDGANAVSRILSTHPAPVIFVTAYPERLLTGETIEPAFVITKPFEPMTLAIATYQAVTGGVHLD
ncbi:MAG: response regulator [Acetobacteraceae bacterium]|nr:response regulator [Acetobacteraceae bacterium]